MNPISKRQRYVKPTLVRVLLVPEENLMATCQTASGADELYYCPTLGGALCQLPGKMLLDFPRIP